MLGGMRNLAILSLLMLTACNSEIYTRDGVTDGDSFYLAPQALQDDNPVLQSWVAYSLMKSACQLEADGEAPARVSNYGCELTSRRHLLATWEEQRLQHLGAMDDYLDTLIVVRDAGYLDEYTAHYFGRRHWQLPAELRRDDFQHWRRKNLRRHKPETRIIGSWGYRQR